MAEIYALIDPETKEVRYIGKANDSAKRLKSHIRDARRRNTPVCQWLNSLVAKGKLPEIKVLQTSAEDWQKAEIDTISKYREEGASLLNVAIGGDNPYCSKEVRQENGRKVSKAIHSDPLRRKLWLLKKGIGERLAAWEKEGNYEVIEQWQNRMREKLEKRGMS